MTATAVNPAPVPAPVVTAHPTLYRMAVGVAVAVRALLTGIPQAGIPVSALDEVMFPIGGAYPEAVWQSMLHTVVRPLVMHLHLSTKQLVVAFVIFESFLKAKPGALRLRCIRPLMLAAGVIAVKNTEDHVLVMRNVTEKLSQHFPVLTPQRLMSFEVSLLNAME